MVISENYRYVSGGREMAHQDIGLDVLERVKNDLADISVVESAPGKLEGRQAVMVLAPKKRIKLRNLTW